MTAHVADLRRQTVDGRPGWVFTWSAPDPGRFAQALALLKATVPPKDRQWRPDSKEWWVRDVYDLSGVFGNWASAVEAVKRQLVLPGFE